MNDESSGKGKGDVSGEREGKGKGDVNGESKGKGKADVNGESKGKGKGDVNGKSKGKSKGSEWYKGKGKVNDWYKGNEWWSQAPGQGDFSGLSAASDEAHVLADGQLQRGNVVLWPYRWHNHGFAVAEGASPVGSA